MSTGISAVDPIPAMVNNFVVPRDKFSHVKSNSRLLSFVLGRLANKMRWSMHQHLFTWQPYYRHVLDQAYYEAKAVITGCVDHLNGNHFRQYVVDLLDEYIITVEGEPADDCWLDLRRAWTLHPGGTRPDGSTIYEHIYHEVKYHLADAIDSMACLRSAMKSHPMQSTETDHAYDVGYYLDQFIRPDNQEYYRTESILIKSITEIEYPGTQPVIWGQHLPLLQTPASALGMPSYLYQLLTVNCDRKLEALQCNNLVEQTASSIFNWLHPLATIENNRALEILAEFDPSMQEAYIAFRFACTESGERLTSRLAYAWLLQNPAPRGYHPPATHETFATYVRKVKKRFNQADIALNGFGDLQNANRVNLSRINHAWDPGQ